MRRLRIKCGSLLSRESTSEENLFRILPIGQVSKNDCGALITRVKRLLCNKKAARNPPTLTMHVAPNMASTAWRNQT